MVVNQVNFNCETEADLKREGTDEIRVRIPKPQSAQLSL